MSKSKKAAHVPADVLERIAKEKLGLETLATRNSDRLDFHDLGVASLRAALEAAFLAVKREGLIEGGAIGFVHGSRHR